VHTFYAPETNTKDTVVLLIVNGANVSFTDDGQFHSVLDAITVQKLTEQMCTGTGTGPHQVPDRWHGEVRAE